MCRKIKLLSFCQQPCFKPGVDTQVSVIPEAFLKVRLLYNHSSSQQENERNRFVVVYLVGLSGELAATELTLDLTLGAVVLQVVGQVAARQLDGAAVGTRDHVEGAGGEVALGGGRQDTLEGCSLRRFWRLEARGFLTCSCFIWPVQRQPSSLWMQRMGSARICCSSSGSG